MLLGRAEDKAGALNHFARKPWRQMERDADGDHLIQGVVAPLLRAQARNGATRQKCLFLQLFNGHVCLLHQMGQRIMKGAWQCIQRPRHGEQLFLIRQGAGVMSKREVGIGKVAINKVPMSTSQDIISLIGIDESAWDRKYLLKFIQGKSSYLISQARGATIKGIKAEVLADMVLPQHTLPIQRRIAATLDKVSEGIALCKQMLADLDELVKSQFVEIFGDPVKNERAWAMKPIKDLYSVGSSKRIYAAEQTTVGVPFLRVSDICSLIDGDNVQPSLYISEDKFAELESNDLVPTANDILVTSRGTIGRCYIIKASDKFYFQDGMVTWLKQKGFDIEPIYVSMLFAANSFSELLDKATNKTTVHYISIDKLAAIPIPVPPIELQKQFTAFVEQADKSKFAVQQQLAELETLKKSLMQEYFG